MIYLFPFPFPDPFVFTLVVYRGLVSYLCYVYLFAHSGFQYVYRSNMTGI
jgi:hypothetical protein